MTVYGILGIFGKKKIDDVDDVAKDLTDEVSNLQDEVGRQNDLLREATSKLKTVRSEYDAIVHDLMKIKKEINEQRQESTRLEQINSGIRDEIAQGRMVLRKTSKDLESAKTIASDLAKSTAKLKETKKEYNSIKARLDNLPRTTIHGSTDTLHHAERLKVLESERQDFRYQIREQHEVIVKLQEQLARAQRRHSTSPTKNSPDKGVVEAASAMVASFRREMLDAQNELAEERARHARTLKRLEDIKKDRITDV